MRAWCLIELGDDRQYGGNTGYDDAPGIYRYDSAVPNSRQMAVGDLIFIRDRKYLTGIALIERIDQKDATKVRQRCPVCNSVNLKERTTRKPKWRCVNGHEFDAPVIKTVPITAFEAHYGQTFRAVPPGFPTAKLKAAALRRNDQLAIEEVDGGVLEKQLTEKVPSVAPLFATSAQLTPPPPDVTDDVGDPDLSAGDTRNKVLRAITLRRGQSKFRKGLSDRYGPVCMISGCTIFAIVEAAHIWEYQGEASNNVKNGLLLRADLHTLFDLNLLAVHPETLKVHLHPSVTDAAYTAFSGRIIRTGKNHLPAKGPLERRWKAFEIACSS